MMRGEGYRVVYGAAGSAEIPEANGSTKALPEIPDAPAMRLPAGVLTVLTLLEAAGFEAYVVGGCVRDWLLGLTPQDYDVCTNARPEHVLALFADYPVYQTGLKHGTLTVCCAGLPVEVTTFRLDGAYQDNRHPSSVRFVGNLQEDLARRDFTINALAVGKDGTLIDPFGGDEALARRIITCVGSAPTRFNEDSLRILRGLRFASQLGFTLAEETAQAMHAHKQLLHAVSAERIREELTKLLCGKNVAAVLNEHAAIFFEILPELAPMEGFLQNNPYHTHDVWGHTIKVVQSTPAIGYLRWAALLHDSGKPHCYSETNGCGHFYGHPKESTAIAESLLGRLRFDHKTKEKILLLVAQHDNPLIGERTFIKRRLRQIGEDGLRDLLQIARADTAGHSAFCQAARYNELDAFEALLNEVLAAQPCFTRKQLAVKGADLLTKGYPSGKELGNILEGLLNAVIEGRCPNNKEALLEFLNQGYLDEGQCGRTQLAADEGAGVGEGEGAGVGAAKGEGMAKSEGMAKCEGDDAGRGAGAATSEAKDEGEAVL